MRPAGDGLRARDHGLGPVPRHGVENIHRVVVAWAVSAANDDNLAVDEGGGVRTARRRDVPGCLPLCPLHRLCTQSVVSEGRRGRGGAI